MRDSRAWLLVARREFVERVRDKSFVVSTALALLILVVVILANAALGGRPSYDLGVVGARGPADVVVAVGEFQGVTIRVLELADEAAAVAALREERVDAALVNGERVVVRVVPGPAQLLQLLQATAQAERLRSVLAGAGLEEEAIAEVLAPQQLPVDGLEPAQPHREENSTVAFVGVLVLYGQLFGYGVWVATGVVEEKSSRVVEVLLSTVRPTQLLRGKIVGLGALGLLQLAVIGTVAVSTAVAAGVLEVPASALAAIALVLVWFVLGFAFYSSLFAVAGSLVSRQEELQNGLLPLQMLVLASFVLSLEATQNPASMLARIASLVPVSAPLAMPPRLVQGEAGLVEALLSIASSVAATALVVPLAAKLYSGAILRIGARVRLRDAWRSRRA